jgi:SAM-dependent methyltransferase
MKPGTTPGYAEDLAWIHEAGFGSLARDGATANVALLWRAGFAEGRVVEFGCGGGTSAEIVAKAGYQVRGVDLSPAMVDLARRRVPGGEFTVGSAYATPVPPCIAVTAIGEVLNYGVGPGTGARAMGALFRRVFAALRPGGFFVLDLAGPGRAPRETPARHHKVGRDWAVLVETLESADGRRLDRQITSFRRVGRHFRRTDEIHRLRLSPAGESASLLRAAGFRVTVRRGYAGDEFAPGHRVFIARRPQAEGLSKNNKHEGGRAKTEQYGSGEPRRYRW